MNKIRSNLQSLLNTVSRNIERKLRQHAMELKDAQDNVFKYTQMADRAQRDVETTQGHQEAFNQKKADFVKQLGLTSLFEVDSISEVIATCDEIMNDARKEQ